jgi:probable H4MPT-linked C1 transfer pathway protein
MGEYVERAGQTGESVIGWDIGGAHLKAARVKHGELVDVVQHPCPLWTGLDTLREGFRLVLDRLGRAELHAATMTGELVDVFATRRQGVARIATMLREAVAPARVVLYGGRSGFLQVDAAEQHAADIASANWHASAALCARAAPDALFVDIGSTTTDIVPIADGVLRTAGYTDAERLGRGELVYTGVVRSYLMQIAAQAPLAGRFLPLVNEWFANAADVYRVLGELPEGADQMPTADGKDKTAHFSRARLARMLGHDAEDAPDAAWDALAASLAEAQLRQIHDGALLVLSRLVVPAQAPVIGAGVGRHLVIKLANRLGRSYCDFAEVLNLKPNTALWINGCASAVAVALLAAHHVR